MKRWTKVKLMKKIGQNIFKEAQILPLQKYHAGLKRKKNEMTLENENCIENG